MSAPVMLAQGFELPSIEFPYLGSRGIVGVVMLIHIFFATLFVGYAVGAPLLEWWGRRRENPHARRLAYSLAHFNVLTFSVGATWAVMFLVLIVGLYPRVTAVLFTHFFWFFPVLAMTAMVLTLWLFYVHFYRSERRNVAAGLAAAAFILLWQALLGGIDTFMLTGGDFGEPPAQSGGALAFGSLGAGLDGLLNPMSYWMMLHRTFANLSWPAFAAGAWAAFMYIRSKTPEDRAFFDWATSVGLIWGTVFLLLQPFVGFLNAYSMQRSSGAYGRLMGTQGDTFTSDLLYVNLVLVVALFVLSNVGMYLGAGRHPDRGGRVPIRFFGLVAAVSGLYAISPLAEVPFLYMRYIMLLVMVLATLGSLVAYLRAHRRFGFGSPGGGYRAVLLALGVLAAVVALNMGWMKSNSRAPYTIYGQDEYRVEPQTPVVPEIVGRQGGGE
ncbi:hypothetical protein Rxycam_01588 [Rubrobacter xylanophilus DSM 9941]|uniref:hypothetical protein n=1 Tax=Rubrobacter xylanophilus TaxID=49319 RepID=UPI001C63E134|nr:hypothetical protein [Rubrobacter xylanophilus]QYJ15760.1 hypothetical protein Rxycam_01588 [Rubrobacter xylanophilus DSM 9941]